MKLVAKSLLIATLAASAASVAIAAQRRMPLEMLCRLAERIVIAEVTGARITEAEWPGLGTQTTTVFTLQIEEIWKGAASEKIEVEVIGGTDPKTGLTHRASGAPTLRIGERALVFIDDAVGDRTLPVSRVCGSMQGKYDLVVKRVVGRPGMPIDEDILTHPLKKRITAILAAQAAQSKAVEPQTGAPETDSPKAETSPTGGEGGGR